MDVTPLEAALCGLVLGGVSGAIGGWLAYREAVRKLDHMERCGEVVRTPNGTQAQDVQPGEHKDDSL